MIHDYDRDRDGAKASDSLPCSSRNFIHMLQIWMCSLLFINMIIIYYPIPALFLFVYLFSFVLNESEILMAIYHK